MIRDSLFDIGYSKCQYASSIRLKGEGFKPSEYARIVPAATIDFYTERHKSLRIHTQRSAF